MKKLFSKSYFNKFDKIKVKYKKDPKKFIVLASSILMAFSVLVGSSYAYLTYVSKTDNKVTINAGNLALEFANEENVISLDNALPQSDKDALSKNTEYSFTIKNTGSIPASYKITLDNMCVVGNSYTVNDSSVTADKCIPNEYIKVGIKEDEEYKVLDFKTSNNNGYVIETGSLGSEMTKNYKMKIWLDYDTPNTYNSQGTSNVLYVGKLGLSYEQGKGLDKSGANKPVLSENMISVYYDETAEVWKKADETNSMEEYKWYNYDEKMWANSVTVSSANRSTYINAVPGTEIPMTDILTMQVWVPRYKYKVFNYNADGTVTSEPQEIDITFENGTDTTGEITCTDSISGIDGATSETCKLKSTNATCTDSTCNNKTYTHPAFTFGAQELKGMWVGKFEVSAPTDSTCYTSASDTNCNKTGITPLVKPDVKSYRYAQVGTFETNMLAMNDSGNIYGFTTADDTHMMKNMEWGAVAYLSHSKYGTCTDGTCKEVNTNNSSGYYTGRSGKSTNVSPTADGTYKYNETKQTTTTLTGGTTITPTITNDTTYPWTETSGLYKSSTQGVNSSATNLTFSFTAPSDNTYLSFDWSVSSESASCDYIYYTISKNGTALSDTGTSTKIGGTTLGTTEDALTYKSVSRKLDAGSYEITFTYKKDSSSAKGTDTGYVKNIKILDSPTVNIEATPIGEGKDGPSASTTGNIYGIYDMSGGAIEYVMGNIVSSDAATMMSGSNTSSNSGYTGKIYNSGSYTSYTGSYSYPENKYLDKYSFGTSNTQRIRSKLGDALKEVYNESRGWYSDSSSVVFAPAPWFQRGGICNGGPSAGVFYSYYNNGNAVSYYSARVVVSVPF